MSATAKKKDGVASLSKADLKRLINREPKRGSPVLSIYLDTDQSLEIMTNEKWKSCLALTC